MYQCAPRRQHLVRLGVSAPLTPSFTIPVLFFFIKYSIADILHWVKMLWRNKLHVSISIASLHNNYKLWNEAKYSNAWSGVWFGQKVRNCITEILTISLAYKPCACNKLIAYPPLKTQRIFKELYKKISEMVIKTWAKEKKSFFTKNVKSSTWGMTSSLQFLIKNN